VETGPRENRVTEASQALRPSPAAGATAGFSPSAAALAGLEPSAALPYRFVVAWAAGWAAIGAVVGGGIAFTRGVPELLPLLRQSVLFAEVVGFTALASARLVFPYYARLPFAVRIALQVLTLLSGNVFGSVAILATQPLYSLARPKTVAVIVLLNAAFAVIVGIALHTYDSMKRQIEESYRVLRQKEAMERELAIAREVQRELLPRAVPPACPRSAWAETFTTSCRTRRTGSDW
jgi:predicted outer membrane lipoprotein